MFHNEITRLTCEIDYSKSIRTRIPHEEPLPPFSGFLAPLLEMIRSYLVKIGWIKALVYYTDKWTPAYRLLFIYEPSNRPRHVFDVPPQGYSTFRPIFDRKVHIYYPKTLPLHLAMYASDPGEALINMLFYFATDPQELVADGIIPDLSDPAVLREVETTWWREINK